MNKNTISRSINPNRRVGKKSKMNKKVNLLRNPFLDSNETDDRLRSGTTARPFLRNPFLNKHALQSEDDDCTDEESDEELNEKRVLQARRDTLAALDPTNKNSRTAEFKMLRVQSSSDNNINICQPSQEASATLNKQQSLQQYQPPSLPQGHRGFQTMPGLGRPHPSLHAQTLAVSDPMSNIDEESVHSVSCSDGGAVPDISTSLATPSSSLSVSSPANERSLSPATFYASTPSTHDLPALEASDVTSLQSYPPHQGFFHKNNSSHRVSGLTGGIHNEAVEDGIDTMIDAASSRPSSLPWSLNRNTFGAPSQQSNREQREQGHRGSRVSFKRSTTGCRLNALDSEDELLARFSDDEVGQPAVRTYQEKSALKGGIGRKRLSATSDVTLDGRGTREPTRPARHSDGDWMVYPRTAAICHNIPDDAIPLPNKTPRQLSLSSNYTTISLTMPSPSCNSTTGKNPSRIGSLNSSFHNLKRGVSNLPPEIGRHAKPSHLDCKVDNVRGQDVDHRIIQVTNGYSKDDDAQQRTSADHGDQPNHRSSAATFGLQRMRPSPTISIFPSFTSLRDFISSATGLSRSSSVPGSATPPPVSPTAFIRRSQTTAFAGHQGFQTDHGFGGRVAFSPNSRRKNTPAMIPTIVIPQCPPDEREALSASTISYTPNSASSSVTITSSSGVVDHCGLEFDDGLTDISTIDYIPYSTMPTAMSQQRFHQEGLLKVPEPAKTTTTTIKPHLPNTLAISAMTAARRAWDPECGILSRSSTSASADSLMGPLTSDDYIGQFERERALARQRSAFGSDTHSTSTSSTGSLATTVLDHTMSTEMFMRGGNKSFDAFEQGHRYPGKQDESQGCLMSSLTSSTLFGFGLHHTSDNGTIANNDTDGKRGKRERQASAQSDISEKLMHLPEPSRFEGICSCRGFINITSMLLILCGLLLLVLGYPIATGLKRERLAAEAAAAEAAAAANRTVTQIKFTMSN